MRAGQIFKFFAGEALRIPGELLASTRPGLMVELTREPAGVVSIITPWNLPIAIPAWKIAPALAYGNAVVFKPAEAVPGSAWALARSVNAPTAGVDPHVPFGGRKASSHGPREQGRYAAEFFTTVKTAYVAP